MARVSNISATAATGARVNVFASAAEVTAPGMAAQFHFEPGQIQILDNRALGHKRTGFTDWPEPERKRLLIRLWLRDSGGRAYNG